MKYTNMIFSPSVFLHLVNIVSLSAQAHVSAASHGRNCSLQPLVTLQVYFSFDNICKKSRLMPNNKALSKYIFLRFATQQSVLLSGCLLYGNIG